MAFTPVFEIESISRDSSYITISDATPSTGSGYGVSNGPANVAAITSLFLSITPYGGDPVNAVFATGYAADDLNATVKFSIDVPDGVDMIKLHYGELKTIGVTVSSDRLSLTITNASVVFAGVTLVSIDGTTFIEVSSIAGDTITLVSELPGSASSLTQIYRYWSAELRSLVLYKANKVILREIDKISMYDTIDTNRINKTLLKMILKESAEREYSFANYAKADEAARLAGGTQPVYTSTCSPCG